jgi:O-acetyl-ADP-ribose deacetylase (regulator of RNase III)
MQKQYKDFVCDLMRADITTIKADAIVNAANTSLLGGGGVDGAIHARGGPSILEECKQIRALNGNRGIAPGEAALTGAGNLPASNVIHAVGPIYRGGTSNEAEILSAAYTNCLKIAQQYQLISIAFPSISTGAYGYPVEEAARIALSTVFDFIRDALDNPPTVDDFVPPLALRKATFVLFDEATLGAYERVMHAMGIS